MDEQAIKTFQGENAEEIPEVESAIAEHANEGQAGEQQHPDASKGMMTVDTLPQEVRDALPADAQQVFIAAYNSIFANNGDKDAAMKVGWQSIEHSELYTRGADGKYQRAHVEDKSGGPQPLSAS